MLMLDACAMPAENYEIKALSQFYSESGVASVEVTSDIYPQGFS